LLLPEAVFGAGNVTVIEEEGNITIRGDRQANAVVIDVATVSGEDGTTINGGSDPLEIPPDGGLDIGLNGGDDFLDLQDVHRTFLHIQMGKGNDVLVFADAGASGECTVDMGKGDDTVVGDFIEDCGGGLTVDTAQGNDFLHFLTDLSGDAVLVGGPGDDDFRFGVAGSIDGRIHVNMGAGDDTLSVEIPVGSGSVVRGGGGHDTLAEVSTSADTTQIQGFEVVTPID